MEEVVVKKQHIRSHYLEQRRLFALNKETKTTAESELLKFLLKVITKDMSTIAIYNSYGSEVCVQALVENLSDKTWVYPRVEGESLAFYKSPEGEFEKSSLGVDEPLLDETQKVELDSVDAVLIPGVAFDHLGLRLGTGKGFYDRALRQYKGLKIGVAFSAQLSQEALPSEGHDIKVEYLVTENFILKV